MSDGLMRGITAPVLTPFDKSGDVDYATYEKLIRYLTESGVHGIFVCGTTGEFMNLTLTERKKLLEAALRAVKPGTHVMYNTAAANLADMADLTEWAKSCGAHCVSVTAPWYHTYDHIALSTWFRRAAELADDMPLYLYNIPAMTHNPITSSVLCEVAASCPNVRGIKDSSMDFMVFLNYQCAVGDTLELLTGNDAQVLTALQAGGAGGVIAMAGVFPKLAVEIWNKFHAGDLQGAKATQTRVLKLREVCRSVMPIMSHKKMLELQGIRMGFARFPFRELTGEEAAKVESAVREYG